MRKLVEILKECDDLFEVETSDKSILYPCEFYSDVAKFTFEGKHFEIIISKRFPFELPRITSIDKVIHSHIDNRGVVCLPNVDELVYDLTDEEAIVKYSIAFLKKLFKMSNDENNQEILYEYNDYLSIFSNYDKNLNAYLLDDSENGYICIDKNLIFIGNNAFLDSYKKACGINSFTRYSYLSLNLKTIPNIKYANLSSSDILSCLTEDSLQRIQKYKNSNINQYYLLKYYNPDKIINYILLIVHATDSLIKSNGLLIENKIDILPVQNVSFEFLRLRGGSKIFDSKVLLIGCGSVGSEISDLLASSGFRDITIVDDDDLKFENGFRNSLGFSFISLNNKYSKADVNSYYLKIKYPDCNITPIKSDIIDLVKEGKIDLKKYNYIISCTGNTLVDNYINNYLYDNKIETYFILSWLEPYGIAEHILSIDTRKKGCFECFIKSPKSIQICSNDGEYYKIRNNVCAGSFTPYGRISTNRLAANTVEIVVNNELGYKQIVNEHIVKKGNMNLFFERGFKRTPNMDLSEEEISKYSKDFIREGCRVCGEFDY